MASPFEGVRVEKFAEGMRRLRTAALLEIIATLLLLGAVVGVYAYLILYLGLGTEALIGVGPGEEPSPDIISQLGAVITIVFVFIGAAIASLILSLIATYGYLIPAASSFAEYDRSRYGTVSTLLKIGFLGGLLSVLGGIGVIAVGAVADLVGFLIIGAIIIIAGAVLLFVGLVGLIMLMFKLKDDTGDDTFLIAGILFIIGIFVTILGFIAWILVYVAAKPDKKPVGSAERGVAELPPPPPV